ncbi:HD-GYP domain-containing protein [Cupriavidus plantarum]|uniref:HD-GYP domain-containing protein (C-di-GMP phosphodiesterase class II) n=1 Tax=Cupriavidus plantarum TaxID=942865 RepID=A0A316EYH2_9BURK|nr:HD-GYP domain-containing protein [Cupriavidus plantarum]NYI00084.1 HD-GYP domain-containing protein (c-di-GMP phosphodiesterase class II) [Cupriavidus plantarum]PWK37276.1 HD-GYP domain-containing protein (c-di-GMP phosphodiesterase class II) [Cupriavidus plantarum]REF01987.1 HD-GYP domain-containing protein (c-di-GMP phosphodiesterase class II) [Cupriavidus plantarum]RLK45166.1 HD-GYP domain-containing protein (c-di-GMP phosphodiesterase class II) [Cupriavidus plantarum]CAG2129137.1 Cyclic
MLRRIKAEQLQVGMFVARLGGPWINHPFWRSRFLVSSDEQVEQIQAANVQDVWIDILKGRNLPTPATPDAMEADMSDDAETGFEDELERARELIKSARQLVGSMFSDVRMGRALESQGALLLVDSASNSLTRHSQALIALSRLKEKDDYSYLHAFSVCVLMIAVGRTLKLPDGEVRELGIAGLMHDIGKLTLPESILQKGSDLTPREEEAMRRHPSAGYRILNEARLYTNIPLDVCVHHHERVDGRGYPFGLVEHEISVHAKIASICDTYDTLTSARPGHLPWSPARAMEYIAVRVDTLFDRRVFKAFTRTVGIYPIGTVLRLRSNRLAVVCGQNENEPLRPRVMAFYSVSESVAQPPQLIDLTQSDETVVAFEDARQWGYSDEQLMAMYAPHG